MWEKLFINFLSIWSINALGESDWKIFKSNVSPEYDPNFLKLKVN